MKYAESWAEVGARAREARLAAGLSQADLARRLGMDRSALARVESGQRQVSALELFSLADALGLPPAHFMSAAPEAVVSRRQDLTEDSNDVSRLRFRLDAALEGHARETTWLADRGFLPRPDVRLPDPATWSGQGATDDQAREAARLVRRALGLTGPLSGLADVCASAGLHLLVADGFQDGACITLTEGLGAAVIGGKADPGRRRATAAHELGHFVLQDEYQTDIGIAESRDEREQRIEAFAIEFLLPEADLRRSWESQPDRDERARLIVLAARYRVSWSVAVRSAQHFQLIDKPTASGITTTLPQRGEFFELLGREPIEDLLIGETSGTWRQAVVQAWRAETITASRAAELLHGLLKRANSQPEDILGDSNSPERPSGTTAGLSGPCSEPCGTVLARGNAPDVRKLHRSVRASPPRERGLKRLAMNSTPLPRRESFPLV